VVQLKLDVRDRGVACQQNFHGEKAVAQLKPPHEGVGDLFGPLISTAKMPWPN